MTRRAGDGVRPARHSRQRRRSGSGADSLWVEHLAKPGVTDAVLATIPIRRLTEADEIADVVPSSPPTLAGDHRRDDLGRRRDARDAQPLPNGVSRGRSPVVVNGAIARGSWPRRPGVHPPAADGTGHPAAPASRVRRHRARSRSTPSTSSCAATSCPCSPAWAPPARSSPMPSPPASCSSTGPTSPRSCRRSTSTCGAGGWRRWPKVATPDHFTRTGDDRARARPGSGAGPDRRRRRRWPRAQSRVRGGTGTTPSSPSKRLFDQAVVSVTRPTETTSPACYDLIERIVPAEAGVPDARRGAARAAVAAAGGALARRRRARRPVRLLPPQLVKCRPSSPNWSPRARRCPRSTGGASRRSCHPEARRRVASPAGRCCSARSTR